MEWTVWIVAGLAGALVGGAVAYWWHRSRGAATEIWQERVRSRSEQVEVLRRDLEAIRRQREELQEALRAEGERRSAAEERASRVGALERALEERDESLGRAQEEKAELQSRISRLVTQREEERKSLEEQRKLVEDAREQLTDTFKALSSEALSRSQKSFLELATETLERHRATARGDLDQRRQAVENLVQPIRESLDRVQAQMQEIDKARSEAYGSVTEQVKGLLESQTRLQDETRKLSRALAAPNVRGRWGEIQLRRVVEIAGMVAHCDFVEQPRGEGDGRLRPDLIVMLPGDTTVVVDAKAPLKAYLEAQDAETDELRHQLLGAHAQQLRSHIGRLAAKGYWDQFESAPEFVVLFVPGESFFSAALERDPSLIEEGVKQKVILATPTTLIALLRAVSYGWRQERLAESAQQVSHLGKELYDRLRILADHLSDLGRNLEKAVEGYNRTIGSLESRVLVTARRFSDLGVSTGDQPIMELSPLDIGPRELTAADWERGEEPEEEEREAGEREALEVE